jgi:beta-glucosidase
VYLDGLDEATARDYDVELAAHPSDADIAILRIAAAYEPRNEYFLDATTHQGSLDYPPDVVEHVASVARAVPVLLDVYLDRAAILTPLEPYASAIVANYGASDRALLDALFGRIAPEGRLPVELPSSMDEVRASHPDVGSDTASPLFPVGTGLTYEDA